MNGDMALEDRIKWTQGLIDIMSDGAKWGIPRCNSIYRVDKPAKTMHLESGEGDSAVEETLRAMSWKVL